MTPTAPDLSTWGAELDHLHDRISAHFPRKEPRQHARAYLQGLLLPVERKNSWQLSEHAGQRTPDGMQRLLNAARWSVDQVRDATRGTGTSRCHCWCTRS